MDSPIAPSAIKLLLAAMAAVAALAIPSRASADGHDVHPMLLRSERTVHSMESGRELLLRFRINDSERVFGRLADESDGRPAALYFLAYSSALKALISDGDRDHDEFNERIGSLTDVLEASSDSPWRDFLLAESNLLQSVVHAKKGRYLRSALAGRRAYREYERLIQRHPAFYDAYKGLGLLHIAVGSLPGFYRTFLSVLGMHGSVDEGVHELRIAADSSLYAREESSILLSLFEIIVDANSGGGRRLEALYRQHPDSPLFGHLYGFYLYSEREADEALAVLQEASVHSRSPEYYDLHFIDFYLAETLFRLGRYSEAVPHYQWYLDHQSGPALKALASLGMGRSLEMMGQRLAAVSFYEDVEASREFDSDRAARRLAAKLLENPMSPVERRLLEGQNAFDSGRYPEAERVLEALLDEEQLTPEQRAEAMYRLARCDHVVGRAASALDKYRAAVAAGTETESRWAPWSSYYIGRIEEDNGKDLEALASYERALSYPADFDYRQALEKNVKVALERLSQNRSR